MARDIASEQQINTNFVKEVEKHPCLYNFELPSYSRRDITDQAWEEVGKATNMSPSACRERWRNLRAVFTRTTKNTLKTGGKNKPYYLSEVMEFIKPFMRPLLNAEKAEKSKQAAIEASKNASKTLDNVPILIDVKSMKQENSHDDSSEPDHTFDDSRQKRKRSIQATDETVITSKRIQVQASSSIDAAEQNAVKSFLNSLLPELNEMSSAQFKSFKRRVLVLIDDITQEIPYEDEMYIM